LDVEKYQASIENLEKQKKEKEEENLKLEGDYKQIMNRCESLEKEIDTARRELFER